MKHFVSRFWVFSLFAFIPLFGARAESICEGYLKSSLTRAQQRALSTLEPRRFATEMITADVDGKARNIVLLAVKDQSEIESVDDLRAYKAYLDAINTFDLRAFDANSYSSLVSPELKNSASREDRQQALEVGTPIVLGNIDLPLNPNWIDRTKATYSVTALLIGTAHIGAVIAEGFLPGSAWMESLKDDTLTTLVLAVAVKGGYDLAGIVSRMHFKNSLWYRKVFVARTDRDRTQTENIEQAFVAFPERNNLLVVVHVNQLPLLRESLLASPRLVDAKLTVQSADAP